MMANMPFVEWRMAVKRPFRRQAKRRRRINLQKALFVLPNLFTLSSVFCGVYAMMLCTGEVSSNDIYRACLAVFFGIFFDMSDGRVARLTRTQSEFGVQLDSLADLVTFGVAPALIVYVWTFSELGILGALTCFVYVACGAIRLARFNVLAGQESTSLRYFIGLPIPLAAGTLITLIVFYVREFDEKTPHLGVSVGVLLVLGLLMVSNVQYRSFKEVKPSKTSMGVLLVLLGFFAVIALVERTSLALLIYFVIYVLAGIFLDIVRRLSRQPKSTSLGRES